MFRVARQRFLLALRQRARSTTVTTTPVARPDRPGRWEVTLSGGRTVVCRVIDQNGELHAIRRGCFAVAVPVDNLEGSWVFLD